MPGQSERVHAIARERYVLPAIEAGKRTLVIRARDVLKDAEATELFPRGRTPMVCNVLRSQKFLRDSGLEIEREEGPPSKQSRNVVVHYRVVGPVKSSSAVQVQDAPAETPEEKAFRLTERLRGLLKSELAEYGGAEGFIRWVRSDENDPE